MTAAEWRQLRRYDRHRPTELSSMERVEYILLLRKLRREVQLSLDLLQVKPEHPLAKGTPP